MPGILYLIFCEGVNKMKKAEVSSNMYTERIVAFIDILGFKKLVERSLHLPEVADCFSFCWMSSICN